MSSDESVPASPPSSLLRNSSPEGSQLASPSCTPAKLRKYGRMFKEVSFSEDASDAAPCSSTAPNETSYICMDISNESGSLTSSSPTSSDSSQGNINDSESGSDDSEGGSDDSEGGSDDSGGGSDDSGGGSGSSDNGSDIACAQELFCGSKKSTDEAVLALMDLFIKKRWKVTTLKDILNFCSEFFPSNMPKSVYKIFQYVESHAVDNYFEVCHYYCSACRSSKTDMNDTCQDCESSSTGVFFELPLAIQIKHYFEHCNLASLLDMPRNQVSDDVNTISDITSSSNYKKLKVEVNGNYDITLLFHSDGVCLVNSSEAHLYPILATICELPPLLRARFIIVAGIWYDAKFSPVMNTFLNPFVSALNEIHKDKIMWTHPITKAQFKSVVVAPVLSADAVARADILVMQHHNGKYGCNNCEQKTKRFKPDDGGTKLRRFLFQERPACLRDGDRMDEQGRKASRIGHPVKGISGEAVVSKIPYFDRGSSAVPEYMHCVLLGVVKHHLKLWFETPGDWNIKDKMLDIDKFLLNVKVTDQFGRIPKPMKDKRHWKASDLRAWLLFFSLPALYEHLKEKYFQHYMLLVSAIFLLLKKEITESDIIRAETKLRLFVRDIGKLYRLNDYTYNVHNLLHLAQHVRRWGPLWATSAFPFESFNNVLGQLATGTKHKGKQIVSKIRIAHGVEILRNKVSQPTAVVTVSDGVLGQPVFIDLDVTAFDLPRESKGYLRAFVKGVIFTTRQYDQKFVRANSYVCSKTGNSVSYGQILYFYEKNSEVSCLMKKFRVEQRLIFSHNEGKFSILHLIPICETDSIISVSALSLTKHAKAGNFLCIQPNTVKKNL